MRPNLLRLLAIGSLLIFFSGNTMAQSFSFNCTRDTVIPGCPPNLCFTLKGIIPDIHAQTNSYTLNPGSTTPGCFPVYLAPNDPFGTSTNLSIDDRYSSVITPGFPFPFYGATYNNLVASTNGYLSFDISLANGFSHYANNGDLPNGAYDRALIMGPYHDLDPSVANSPTKRIQYQVWGIAPHRRWILSFYRVPLFQCNTLIENTHQIILYESTGIFEVKIFDKQICAGWQAGKGMVGIQDFSKSQGMTAPLRRMSDPAWGSVGMNETWRFVPSGGASLLKRVELYDLSNNLIATGTTGPSGPGTLEASFANICPPAGTITSYIIKSVYQKIDDPLVEIFGTDTVRVDRSVPLTGNATSTPAGCGLSNGTITVLGTAGGTPPYEYSLDGVTWQSSNVFSGLAAGNYTLHIRDFGSVCTTTIPVTVNTSGNIPATTTATPTACSGVNNGSITITSAGGSGPYVFSLDGGPPVAGTIPFTFSNLAAGAHTILVTDQGLGCSTVLMNVNVPAGSGVTATGTSTPTTCTGVSNGTITVTALTGIAPFTWQLDGGAIVPGASPYTFTNVAAGPHNIRIYDNAGCVAGINVNVTAGPGINGTTSSTATSCAGAANGTITATALTGTAPFTWQLDVGPILPGASPFTFTNVTAGPHTITITDNLGCNTVLNEIVAAGAGINGSTSSTATSCPAVANGTITATALSGTAPYTWSLDGAPAVPGASPFTFTNVPAGPHTVRIIDNLGCDVVLNQTVLPGTGNTGTTTSTATSCAAVSNGTITARALSGTAPFTWSLDGAPAVSGASPFTFTNVPAGPHTVRIIDNIGCDVVLNETVLPGIGNTGTITSTATSCPAVSNGTITATALTGAGPFTWSLDGAPAVSGASPFTFTNVPAGPHTVRIIDNIGCDVVLNETVLPGIGNTGTITSTATSCPAVSNGTITATALTGAGPFTWSLDGAPAVSGASPFTFTNVPAGPHTVRIIDNIGCDVVLNETVLPGAANTGIASSTATSCATVSNGTVTATALTGTAPFTWKLDGGPFLPGASPYTFINVAAGAHTVTIDDNVGCSVVVNVTVNAGAGITANLTSAPTACAGVPNGTITVDATTGIPPFTYQLDGGAPQSGANPYTFINVAAGLHSITVVDNVGCSFTNTVTVAVGAGVAGNATSTATSCPTAINGTVTADATAGTAPFTYQLDAGAPQSGANPYTFMNVAAGPHNVTIRDNFGCSSIIPVSVTAGPPLTATTSTASTTCSGASDGTITVTPSNGIAPYTWQLDGGAFVPGASPHTFTNVPAGNHTIVIMDAAGCVSASIPAVVNAGPVLTTTVTVTDALCNGGATGTITIAQPAIGVPPFEYSLDGVNWQLGNIFNGLAAGNYTAYYRESLGCLGSQPVTVSEPAGMTSSSATVPAICNGQPNGIITITAGGGVAPYQYSIDGGLNWQPGNIFNVGAGNYTIIIRDANNCTKNQPATVTEPAAISASSVNTDASCDGGNDGVITVNASGGNSAYTYSIDGVNFQASNVFNVDPGSYTVTVTDNLGCTTSFNTVVGLANNLTFTPQADPTICESNSTQLELTSNATIYSWTPATGLSNTTIPNPVANPVMTTQYIVTATLGRCSANDTVIVNVNPAPVPDAGPDGFICYGQTYQLQGSGGVQYTWTPSTHLSSVSVSNPVSTPVKTITYTLSQVIDALGCKSLITDQVTVDVTPPIKVKTFPYDTIAYPGDQFQLNATSTATSYSWSPATGLSDPNIPNPVLTVGPIGSDILYQVIASTAAGCKGEGYVSLKVYKGPELYVPTAFTPNGDGLNDLFYPFPVGIKSINYFRVFNRWGQLLFSSTTLYKGWDGKLQGAEQPSGVYVFMAEGVDKNGKLITHKGTVTLIR